MPPLLKTRGVPEYRRECLHAGVEFYERRGNASGAAPLREALAAIEGDGATGSARLSRRPALLRLPVQEFI